MRSRVPLATSWMRGRAGPGRWLRYIPQNLLERHINGCLCKMPANQRLAHKVKEIRHSRSIFSLLIAIVLLGHCNQYLLTASACCDKVGTKHQE